MKLLVLQSLPEGHGPETIGQTSVTNESVGEAGDQLGILKELILKLLDSARSIITNSW